MTKQWQLAHTLDADTSWFGGVRDVAVSPNNQSLACAGDDATIKLWDLNSGQLQATLSSHSSTVRTITFSHDGQTLLVAVMTQR
jgi:WD40 repeat protein